MIRRPPRSTLVPYTTPLRSRRAGRSAAVAAGTHAGGGGGTAAVRRRRRRRLRVDAAPHAGDGPAAARRRRLAADRKSTRLNSSHANISYAVFCLKKKRRLAV